MEESHLYIGAPNGIVLCVDHAKQEEMQGRFYHGYSTEATRFQSTEQVLFQFERFFDALNFPYPATSERTFHEANKKKPSKEKKAKKMSDEELLKKHGELGTFIVRVQHRQNSSWQGRITWMERNRTLYFRSIWEMVKLIASAVETSEEESEQEKEEPTWFDEPEDR